MDECLTLPEESGREEWDAPGGADLEGLQDEYRQLGRYYARLCQQQSMLESGQSNPSPWTTWALLEKQRRAMSDYLTILGERISLAAGLTG